VELSFAFTSGLGARQWWIPTAVKGNGSVVVYAPGAIHKLTLGVNEEYLIHPAHLVAWSGQKPIRVAMEGVKVDYVESTAKFGTFMQYWLINQMRKMVYGGFHHLKAKVWGERDALYKLSGPGEFYLSTRKEQKLSGLISAYVGLRDAGDQIRLASRQQQKPETRQ
jgi:uncharacterized protein (AIM24 family)